MRQEDSEVLPWVDAISVNQRDDHERRHQVQQMAQIYSNARKVLVWLGLDQDGSGRNAFDLARKLTTGMLYREEIIQEWWSRRAEIAFFKILTAKKWFHRIWTMQEIGLASVTSVHCGNNQIDWEDLFTSFHLFHQRLTFRQLRCLAFDPFQVVFLMAGCLLQLIHGF